MPDVLRRPATCWIFSESFEWAFKISCRSILGETRAGTVLTSHHRNVIISVEGVIITPRNAARRRVFYWTALSGNGKRCYMPRQRKVKWFRETTGYGFIDKEDGEKILEHFSEIASAGRTSLFEGEDAAFDSFTDPQGPNAPHVVKLLMAPSKTTKPSVI